MVVFAGVLLAVAHPCAADGPSREYLVKAAFIYNFTQFVTWPKESYSGADAPFVVEVIGDDPFDGALDQAMANKAVDNHPIVVRHAASADQLGPCQLVFLPLTEDENAAALLARIGNGPVLTIGESENFLPAGGAIRFLVEDNRMRFEINPAVIDAARLKVSAKLMKLARIYKG